MSKHFILCIAMVACSSPASRPGASDDLSAHVPRSPPATPAPQIEWVEHGFKVTVLPAVAHAGEVVVVPIVHGDGGRGYANLAIEMRTPDDKVVQTIPVMTSNEYEKLVPDGTTPSPELVKRIADANAELTKLHGIHLLDPLTPIAMGDPQDVDDPHLASDSRLEVEWRGNHLRVTPHTRTVPVVDRDGTPWLARDHEPCAGCGVCHNEAFLSKVYRSESAKLVVVEIGYRGTDSCWEPGSELHVVTW
jgi:hypothetical protein